MRKTSLSDITGSAAIGYQGDRRLSQIRYRKPGGAELSQFDCAYSASGTIQTWSQRRDTATADLWTLGYDAADQLTSAQVSTGGTAAPGYAYGYDLGGNRTQEQALGTLVYAGHNELNQVTGLAPTSQTTSVRIAGTGNQASVVTANGQPATGGIAATNFAVNLPLAPGASTVTVLATTPAPDNKTTTQHYAVPVGSSATVASFVYDPVGNLVSQKGGTVGAEVTYAWDAANRLVKISKPGAVTEFVYDGFSRRVAEKYNGNIIKRWIWFNGDAQPAEERDAGNAVTRRFYSGMGEQSGGTNYYYTVDHLGSVRELTDATGAVRARYAYDPFGRRTKVSGDLEASFGYTGYYQHAASGLSLALYRAFDPRLGRFISRDPIEEKGGVNLYGYTANSPLIAKDVFGLDLIIQKSGPSEPMGHLSVGTKNSRGCIRTTSFGAKPGIINRLAAVYNPYESIANGVVYEDEDTTGDFSDTFQTSAAEDDYIQSQLQGDEGREDAYDTLLYNCRDYSRKWFNKLKKDIENKRRDVQKKNKECSP